MHWFDKETIQYFLGVAQYKERLCAITIFLKEILLAISFLNISEIQENAWIVQSIDTKTLNIIYLLPLHFMFNLELPKIC